MKKLFSNQEKKLLPQVDKSEKELQQFIWNNRNTLFPEFTFITQEFQLKGTVHASGSSGRIDILAYNSATRRFVFFELKKNFDKNIGYQATSYRQYIKKNFLNVYVDALQKYKVTLPDKKEVNDKEVEMVLIAKEFTPLLIDQAEDENLITLIEYNWFESDLILLDYVHNAISPLSSKDIDKIWERIQVLIKKREENVKNFADGEKKKNLEDFLRIAIECVATRNAQRLLGAATQPKRPLFLNHAQKILDLQQNSLTNPGLE